MTNLLKELRNSKEFKEMVKELIIEITEEVKETEECYVCEEIVMYDANETLSTITNVETEKILFGLYFNTEEKITDEVIIGWLTQTVEAEYGPIDTPSLKMQRERMNKKEDMAKKMKKLLELNNKKKEEETQVSFEITQEEIFIENVKNKETTISEERYEKIKNELNIAVTEIEETDDNRFFDKDDRQKLEDLYREKLTYKADEGIDSYDMVLVVCEKLHSKGYKLAVDYNESTKEFECKKIKDEQSNRIWNYCTNRSDIMFYLYTTLKVTKQGSYTNKDEYDYMFLNKCKTWGLRDCTLTLEGFNKTLELIDELKEMEIDDKELLTEDKKVSLQVIEGTVEDVKIENEHSCNDIIKTLGKGKYKIEYNYSVTLRDVEKIINMAPASRLDNAIANYIYLRMNEIENNELYTISLSADMFEATYTVLSKSNIQNETIIRLKDFYSRAVDAVYDMGKDAEYTFRRKVQAIFKKESEKFGNEDIFIVGETGDMNDAKNTIKALISNDKELQLDLDFRERVRILEDEIYSYVTLDKSSFENKKLARSLAEECIYEILLDEGRKRREEVESDDTDNEIDTNSEENKKSQAKILEFKREDTTNTAEDEELVQEVTIDTIDPNAVGSDFEKSTRRELYAQLYKKHIETIDDAWYDVFGFYNKNSKSLKNAKDRLLKRCEEFGAGKITFKQLEKTYATTSKNLLKKYNEEKERKEIEEAERVKREEIQKVKDANALEQFTKIRKHIDEEFDVESAKTDIHDVIEYTISETESRSKVYYETYKDTVVTLGRINETISDEKYKEAIDMLQDRENRDIELLLVCNVYDRGEFSYRAGSVRIEDIVNVLKMLVLAQQLNK